MADQTKPQRHTSNKPGVPILPGVNTPFAKSAPPRRIPAPQPTTTSTPASEAPAPKQEK